MTDTKQLLRLAIAQIEDQLAHIQGDDWEKMVDLYNEHNTSMDRLMAHVQSHPLTVDEKPLLKRLIDLHERLEEAVMKQQVAVRMELRTISRNSKLGEYAPLPESQGKRPRYYDEAA